MIFAILMQAAWRCFYPQHPGNGFWVCSVLCFQAFGTAQLTKDCVFWVRIACRAEKSEADTSQALDKVPAPWQRCLKERDSFVCKLILTGVFMVLLWFFDAQYDMVWVWRMGAPILRTVGLWNPRCDYLLFPKLGRQCIVFELFPH